MVYEDESSNDYSILLYISSSSNAMEYQVPASIECQDYMGAETTPVVPSEHHGLAAERRVAFEGFDAGRRFLVCAKKNIDEVEFAAVLRPASGLAIWFEGSEQA
ncbi:hypothetical protein D1007_10511 [Hordeum vulgare]|nr:hypothetical protein D1007_10511 [Hordeum vulgare]